MVSPYQQIGKILSHLVSEGVIPPSCIKAAAREKYFGKYVYAIKFQPKLSSFIFYNERLDYIRNFLKSSEIKIVSNNLTKFIYIYGNSEEDLLAVLRTVTDFTVAEINLIRQDYLDKKIIAKPKKKLYYNIFHYRIKVYGPLPIDKPETVSKLNASLPNGKICCKLKPYHTINLHNAYNDYTFIYVETEEDLMTACLLLSGEKIEITSK